MLLNILKYFSFLLVYNYILTELNAQSLSIDFSSSKIALNEAFSISIESIDERIERHTPFPEIEGFKKIKGGVSNATATSTLNGKLSSTFIRTQIYHPLKEGKFVLKPFVMEVNGKKVESQGLIILVGQTDETKGKLIEFSYEDLFSSEDEKKFIEVQDDAFLGLSVNKEEVFVGEDFTISLALYVAASNKAPMKFYDMGLQVEEISKRLKPSNCWEENFGINEIQEARLEINGKVYDQYMFYQASFFPINSEPIVFPKVGLKMGIKNRIAKDEKNPNEFKEQSKSDLKTFYTQAKVIKVKSLPPHPLKDKVAVGNFYLEERISQRTLTTGENFKYDFIIHGQGNISAMESPQLINHIEFDFYSPRVDQFINRGQGRVTGTKIFAYQVIPKEAGDYALGNYLNWIFFNPISEKYDTLHPLTNLKISGESLKNTEISATSIDKFYEKIKKADNTLIDKQKNNYFDNGIIILLLLMLIVSIVLTYLKVRI